MDRDVLSRLDLRVGVVQQAVEKDRLVGTEPIGPVLDPQVHAAAQDIAELVDILVQPHDVNVVPRQGRDANQLALVIPGDLAFLQARIRSRRMAAFFALGLSSLDQTPLGKPQQIARGDLQRPGQGIQGLEGRHRLIGFDRFDRRIGQPGTAGQPLQRQAQTPSQDANDPKIVIAVHYYAPSEAIPGSRTRSQGSPVQTTASDALWGLHAFHAPMKHQLGPKVNTFLSIGSSSPVYPVFQPCDLNSFYISRTDYSHFLVLLR